MTTNDADRRVTAQPQPPWDPRRRPPWTDCGLAARPRSALARTLVRLAATLAATLSVVGCGGGSESASQPPGPPPGAEATEYSTQTSSRLAFDVGTAGAGPAPRTFTLVAAPEGMTLGPQNGQIEWVPQPEQIGAHAVTVAVTDASGATTTKGYRVEVTAPDGLPAYLVLRTEAVAVQPGQPVRVSWQLGGDLPAAASIELGLQAPAVDPAAPEGAPMAWTLAADGTWSAAPVKLGPAARSGQATLTLPSRLAGRWTVALRLRDAAGQSLTVTTASVLVADAPTLKLALSRTQAKPLDRVRAVVDLSTGATAQPVRLMAWMVQPDGQTVGLPGLGRADLEVAREETASGRYKLLDREFTAREAGDYRVHARAYAVADGRLLQEASAKFTVCSADSTVSGRVLARDRTPFDGEAAPLAAVRAVDGASGASLFADISKLGEYTLALPSGSYRLSAQAVDASGTALGSAETLVVAGCTASSTARDFVLTTR